MSIYERLIAGEVLQVKFKTPLPGLHKKPFKVSRLLMMGPDYYVTEKSEWARFASVGGITINTRRRHRMESGEMQAWCEKLEVIEHVCM